MVPTRATILVSLLLFTAGCPGWVPADGPESETTPSPTAEPRSSITDDAQPPDDSTSGPTPGEATRPESTFEGTEGWSEEADPDKEIRLENARNRLVEIRIRVVREATNATVHEGTYTLEPGEQREVYNTADADPDGAESFRVTATVRNTTESVTSETSACHGTVYVEVLEDGTLYPYYAIC